MSSTSIGGLKSGVALREEFVGARVKTIEGEEKSITQVNYFKGNDPSKWKTNVSTYDMVNLGEIYKGIELRLKAYGDNVEKLFCVKSGADPEQIKISLSGIQPLKNPPPSSPSVRGTDDCPPLAGAGGGLGARGLWVNEEGQLVAETELGPVKFTKPIAYQEIDGKRVDVDVEYRIQKSEVRSQIQDAGASGAGNVPKQGRRNEMESEVQNVSSTSIGDPQLEYGFKVAAYDKTKPLVIDPLLASTFLGGTSSDWGNSLALDTSGNVYVTGETWSTDFPTTSGAYGTSKKGDSNSGDVFISKLDSGLTSLLASTYLGGSDRDYGNFITLDTSGNVYVTGEAWSTDFPTTSGVYDTSSGGRDVFLSKLDGGLTSLLASTSLGGSGIDTGFSLTLDTSGNVYVTGETSSSYFPTTSGAYDTSIGGGDDAFISKLDSGLTSLLASTYLGGSSSENGISLTLDTSGSVYVTGHTTSQYFPTTSEAYDTTYSGGYDVFVSKLDGELTNLLASTYLGGPDRDWGNSLALDTNGNVYVTGQTYSSDFPTTSGAYDTSFSGGKYDVFVSKLDGDLSASTSTPTPMPTSTPTPTVTATPLPTLPPLATPTPPSLPTPSPFPTPGGCSASAITAFPFSLVINKSKTYKDAITVWVLGDGGCAVQNAKVKAKLDKVGRKILTVKPSSQKTNQLGVATFSIKTKKKAGNATITFSTQGAGFSITTIASVVVTE